MSYSPTIPTTFDICVFEDISLQEISAYRLVSLFSFLGIKGKYPAILHDEIYGKEAQQLFDDAQHLLSQLIESKRLKANAVCRIFPVNSINDDDIEIYTDNSRKSVLTKLHFLRQQNQKLAISLIFVWLILLLQNSPISMIIWVLLLCLLGIIAMKSAKNMN